jgi:tryptophanyl-tRNA synthetase
MNKQILVSGIQSSGKLHIGNYFGAIKQNVDLGNSGDYAAYVFIADYHSMTSLTDAHERTENTLDAACTYLACGLDPSKVALFRQSDIPEVHELTWILNTLTPMPMLMLAHAFKDKEAKNADINVGLFDYPVLMASDILIYGAHIVPVGKDQEQHIEIARELAGKYNRAYGEYFHMPKAYIKEEVATVPGVDGIKMSKSKNNHIPLFATDDEIRKKVMTIVTDSARPEEPKNPDENNVYQIHKLFLSKEEDAALRARYREGGLGYKEAKELCAEAIIDFVSPMREKYDYYKAHPAEVEAILTRGAEEARKEARKTINAVRKATGLGSK